MCWAYIAGKSCSSLLKVQINPYVILFLGALPDIDLLLGGLGITHRGITHSVLFWSMVFVPIFVKYRKRGIPYFIAPIQHILLGDLVVATSNPFWPLDFSFGLDFRLFSVENISLEVAGLVIFLIWTIKSEDGKIFLTMNRRCLWSILPLIPLVGFLLFLYQQDMQIVLEHGTKPSDLDKIARWTIRNSLFPVVIITHSILAAFLSISFIQGSRALIGKPIRWNL